MKEKHVQFKSSSPLHVERPVEEFEGGLNISGLLACIRRRWIVVAVTTLSVSSITFLWSATRPTLFRGHFQILVEPVTAESEVVAAVTGESKTVIDQDLGETQLSKEKLDYETQFQVLLSRKLLEPVAQTLETQYPEVNYDYLRNKLKISRLSDGSKIIQVEYYSMQPEQVESILNAVSRSFMSYSLTERQTNIRRAIEFADGQLPNMDREVKQLEQKLQQFGERYFVSDPQVYIEDLTRRSFEIEQKLSNTRVEVTRQRKALESIKQQTQLGSKSGEIASVLSQAPEYIELKQKLQAIETEIELKSATLTLDNPIIVDLKEERDRLLPLVEKAAESSAGASIPSELGSFRDVPYQNSLRQNLIQKLQETELTLKELVAIEDGLTKEYQDLQQQLMKLPEVNRLYDSLQRQLKIASENLENFEKVRSNLMINAARQETPWELIEKPSTKEQIALSSVPRDVALGLFLGLLLGSGIAILLDKVRNTINSLDDLRRVTELPILGAIPLEQNLREKIAPSLLLGTDIDRLPFEQTNAQSLAFSNSSFFEAFRSLYIRLCSLRTDAQSRSVVISSCTPGEGTSTIASTLAQAVASMGLRVLLVDLNLRSPVIHERLSLPRKPGISEMLTLDQDATTTVKMIEWVQNLYVVTAGTPINNYSQYLTSEKMSKLMLDFQDGFFDFVIYDSCSLSLSDALLFSTHTDGILLNVKLGKLDKNSLEETLYKISDMKVNVMGLVANGIE